MLATSTYSIKPSPVQADRQVGGDAPLPCMCTAGACRPAVANHNREALTRLPAVMVPTSQAAT